MNYLARTGERFVIRLINYGIMLHLSFCIAAIGMTIAAPFVVFDLIRDVRLAGVLISEASVISAPLVNRSGERPDSRSGKYLCYLELPGPQSDDKVWTSLITAPYLRANPPGALDSLQVFSHPALLNTLNRSTRVVEVPVDRTWISVFQLLRGRSIVSTIMVLCFQGILGTLVIYVALKGYFLIKGDSRRRHPRRT
jgi:hypothetical protein